MVGNGGSTQEPFKPLQPEWSAARKDMVIGTLRVDVDPFGPRGMTRLVLGEYAASDGRPIEKGIILERPPRHPRSKQAAGAPVSEAPATLDVHSSSSRPAPSTEVLPVTGGLPGVTATGVVAAGVALATTALVGRLREPDADDLQV